MNPFLVFDSVSLTRLITKGFAPAWPAAPAVAQRKQNLFTDRFIDLGLSHLCR